MAQTVDIVTEILKNIGENIDTNHLKNFNNANKIIETKYCVFWYAKSKTII